MKLQFKDGFKGTQADPFVCEVDGGWAMYVSGCGNLDGIGAYAADSPFGPWEYKGLILQMEGHEEYWAPCIIRLDDWYYLYFSVSNDKMFEHLHVAKSKSPFGPFQDIKRLYPYFSIDPHMVRTEKGLFLFYTMDSLQSERVGSRIYVEKFLDPYTPSGHPVEAVVPTFDEEIFMRDRFQKGQDWHTIEGAFWLEHDGYQYLMYSGACYQNTTYHIGYSWAESSEQDLTKVLFEKHTDNGKFVPLITKNEYEQGCGHHSVIKYEGEYYAVYHGREIGETFDSVIENRTARFCKLHFNKGIITAERLKEETKA